MTVQKAFFEIIYSGNRKNEQIPVMFNPETVTITRSNRWAMEAAPGKPVKTAQFKGSEAGELSLPDLWFDTTDTGEPVTKYTDKLMSLLDLDVKVPGTNPRTNNARPPVVKFHWGHIVSFPAYVEEVEIEFTYFSAAGVPLRARVEVELKQFHASGVEKQNPTSGTPYPHRVHQFMPGETLDRISAEYYGDATRWRALASANGIEDPLAIRPGTSIVIPEITSL